MGMHISCVLIRVAFRGQNGARRTGLLLPISASSLVIAIVIVIVIAIVTTLGLEFTQQRAQGLCGDFQTKEFREFDSIRTPLLTPESPAAQPALHMALSGVKIEV
jgi:hypothetical protein